MITLKMDLGVIAQEPEAQAEILDEFYDAVFHIETGNLYQYCITGIRE